ncbi:hypothetical protein PDJAM_G00234950, partial [Pangasius djambal]|nr:hypothetical protein [Pangasius djambal]
GNSFVRSIQRGCCYFLHASFTAPRWLWARASNHDSALYDHTAGLNNRRKLEGFLFSTSHLETIKGKTKL